MKKLMIAAAIAATAGAGGYLYQTNYAQDSQSSLLAQVPADTLMVLYQTEPVNQYEYMNAFGTAQQTRLAELLADKELTPGVQFAVNLIDSYTKSASDPETLKAYFGTGDMVSPLVYTLGIMPVYKLDIENPAALWKTLDEQEKLAGIEHELVKLDSVEYRRYKLAGPEDSLPEIALAISVLNNVLTITLDAPGLDAENPIKMALGVESPKVSILDTGRLEAMQTKYGTNNNSFGFFDFREIIKGLTTSDGNMMARQMLMGEPKLGLDELRSPACHTEFTQVAENWPQMVAFAEYTNSDGKPRIDGSLVFESKNKVILDALKAMRGVLPEASSEKSIFSLAMGIDVAKLAPQISSIWTDLTEPEYQCSLLANAQRDIRGQNPAPAIAMGASMANGLKGFSMDIFDLNFSVDEQGAVKTDQMDMLFSLSADDPSMLLQTATMFVPELAQLEIKSDNKPVNLRALLEQRTSTPMEEDVYARLNDKHLTIYMGDVSEKVSNKVMEQSLNANGLMSMSMDTRKMLQLMETAAEVSGEPLPPEVIMHVQAQMDGSLSMDITKDGIAVDFDYYGLVKPAVKVAQQ